MLHCAFCTAGGLRPPWQRRRVWSSEFEIARAAASLARRAGCGREVMLVGNIAPPELLTNWLARRCPIGPRVAFIGLNS